MVRLTRRFLLFLFLPWYLRVIIWDPSYTTRISSYYAPRGCTGNLPPEWPIKLRLEAKFPFLCGVASSLLNFWTVRWGIITTIGGQFRAGLYHSKLFFLNYFYLAIIHRHSLSQEWSKRNNAGPCQNTPCFANCFVSWCITSIHWGSTSIFSSIANGKIWIHCSLHLQKRLSFFERKKFGHGIFASVCHHDA